MKYRKNLLIVGMLLLVASCAGHLTMQDNNYKPVAVQLTQHLPDITLKFKRKLIPNSEITTLVFNKLHTNISTLSNTLPPPKFERAAGDKVLSFVSNLEDNAGFDAGFVEQKRSSIVINTTSKFITVNILSGEYLLNGRKGEAKISAKFPVKVVTKGGLMNIVISYPSSYSKNKGNMGMAAPALPLFNDNEMPRVLAKIYKLMNIDKIQFNDGKHYSGEIKGRYSDSAIYANFQRMQTGNTNDKNKIQKIAIVPIQLGKFTGNATVEIYPYHDKSKIIYNLDLSRTVSLFSDGSSKKNKYPDPSKIKDIISKIANE